MSTPFQMSHGLNLLQPKTSRAYPVPCEEWALIKDRLQKVSGSPFIFQTLGSTLIGAALATFLALITDSILPGTQGTNRIIGWAIVVVTTISGALFLWFAHQQQGLRKYQVADVVAQMELIEQRYQPADDIPATAVQTDALDILEAKYGRGEIMSDVTDIVKRNVVHGRLRMIVDNATFGDPCVGEQKQLRVSYRGNGEKRVVVVKEGGLIEIP